MWSAGTNATGGAPQLSNRPATNNANVVACAATDIGLVDGQHDRHPFVGAAARRGEQRVGVGRVEPGGRSFEQQH